MKKYHLFLFFLALSFGLVSCSKDDDSAGSEGTAKVAVKLTDAPGDYDEVWIDVKDVMIKTTVEGSDEEGWESIGNVEARPYDLLTLTGGVTELLASAEIPAGFLSQIRLVLGTANYVVVDGNELVLKTPSAEQSGLKLQVNQELKADAEYTYIMDFDVDKSIVKTAAGGYILKPVIRLSVEENSGSITGTVSPSTEQVVVTAKNAKAEVSAYTNAEGKFELHGLPAGTYLVTATPAAGTGLQVAQINNVVVAEGETVNLDPIFLNE